MLLLQSLDLGLSCLLLRFQITLGLLANGILLFDFPFQLLDELLSLLQISGTFGKHIVKLLLHALNVEFELLFNANVGAHVCFKLLDLLFIFTGSLS